MKIPVIRVKDMQTGQVHIVGTDPLDNLQIDINGNIFYYKDDAIVKRELLSVEFMEPAEYLKLMMSEMMELPTGSSVADIKECAATSMFDVVQMAFKGFENSIRQNMDIVTKDRTLHITPYNYLHIMYAPELVKPDERGYPVIIINGIDSQEYEEIIRLKDEKMANDLVDSIQAAINRNHQIFDVEKWISEYEEY